MKINEKKLKELNLSVCEIFLLFIINKYFLFSNLIHGVVAKGYVEVRDSKYFLTKDGERALYSIFGSNLLKSSINEKELQDLAEEIREFFPKGIKDGTNTPWRCSVFEIVFRLKNLSEKTGFEINKDKIVDATKRYIKSYENDQRFMHTLKYFIYKNKFNGSEIEFESPLLNFIENKETKEEDESDWTKKLI